MFALSVGHGFKVILDPQYCSASYRALADSSGVVRRDRSTGLLRQNQKDPGVLSQVKRCRPCRETPVVNPRDGTAFASLEQPHSTIELIQLCSLFAEAIQGLGLPLAESCPVPSPVGSISQELFDQLACLGMNSWKARAFSVCHDHSKISLLKRIPGWQSQHEPIFPECHHSGHLDHGMGSKTFLTQTDGIVSALKL